MTELAENEKLEIRRRIDDFIANWGDEEVDNLYKMLSWYLAKRGGGKTKRRGTEYYKEIGKKGAKKRWG